MATVSKGNNKLGNIPNISLPPIVTCSGCAELCGKACYAAKFYKMWPTVKRCWDNNLEHLQVDPKGYFNEITASLKKIKNKRFFRWHVSGDIVDAAYFVNMRKIAHLFPDTKFLAFTKQFNLINTAVDVLTKEKLPTNLQIIFSAWPGLEMPNPYNFRVAWMNDGTDSRIPEDAFECAGDCTQCSACFSLDKIGKDVVFHKH